MGNWVCKWRAVNRAPFANFKPAAFDAEMEVSGSLRGIQGLPWGPAESCHLILWQGRGVFLIKL
ncbi:hypothetical protein AC812_08945 [Bellilinea caldifistulae]|uniref:Uncharacterized protein n=1 Tax=Bellilinea caldifistulae TaxID=360411 RepID=A0A0P6XIP2_9CHLR|nr:hypothetical protein AC812_08945 [Bellilinea caldifistulae]